MSFFINYANLYFIEYEFLGFVLRRTYTLDIGDVLYRYLAFIQFSLQFSDNVSVHYKSARYKVEPNARSMLDHSL